MNIKYLQPRNLRSVYVFVHTFVVCTKSFNLFAYISGTSVGFITGIFSLLNVIFLVFHYKLIRRSQSHFLLLPYYIFIPILLYFFHEFSSLRVLFLQFYYFSIVIVAGISILAYFKEIKNALITSIVFNFLFGIYSIVNPDFFIQFADLSNHKAYYGGRAISFFLQPNDFGTSSVLLFILSIQFIKGQSKPLFFLILLLTAVITFSRSAIGLFFICILILVLFRWKYLIKRLELFLFSGIKLFGFILAIIVVTSYIPVQDAINELLASPQVKDRIEFFINFNGETFEKDKSMISRLKYQQYYEEKINERFILGHGMDASKVFREKGELMGAAHQIYLETLFSGGIIYLFSFFLILILVFHFFIKNLFVNKDKALMALQLLFFLIIYSFFAATMMEMRILHLVLGALIQFPRIDYFKNVSQS